MALKRSTHSPIYIYFLLCLHPQRLERRRSGSGVINPGIIHPPAPQREPREAGLEGVVISESAARLSPAGRTLGSFQPQKLKAPAYRGFFRTEKKLQSSPDLLSPRRERTSPSALPASHAALARTEAGALRLPRGEGSQRSRDFGARTGRGEPLGPPAAAAAAAAELGAAQRLGRRG